ncbi:hypothetical protein NDU88_001545 [Pleurodeles waltl]|uniref:Uncharacterized protein n=1 Tax=Pleurodeles waltl TaxID=8319 RepID=A0AAV7V827_PLEWA|nr:hypothetical protein NDU88_001545 [Pleurodeles waltl]
MAWAYFCWRDGGGLVISSLSLPADVAACSGGRIFGGLAVVGQNDRGGFLRPRRCYGGLLTGVQPHVIPRLVASAGDRLIRLRGQMRSMKNGKGGEKNGDHATPGMHLLSFKPQTLVHL